MSGYQEPLVSDETISNILFKDISSNQNNKQITVDEDDFNLLSTDIQMFDEETEKLAEGLFDWNTWNSEHNFLEDMNIIEEQILNCSKSVMFPDPNSEPQQYSLSALEKPKQNFNSYSFEFDERLLIDSPKSLNVYSLNDPRYRSYVFNPSHLRLLLEPYKNGSPVDIEELLKWMNFKFYHIGEKSKTVLYFAFSSVINIGQPGYLKNEKELDDLIGGNVLYTQTVMPKDIKSSHTLYFYLNPESLLVKEYLAKENLIAVKKPRQIKVSKFWWDNPDKITCGSVRSIYNQPFGPVGLEAMDKGNAKKYNINENYFNLWSGFPYYGKKIKDHKLANDIIYTYLTHLYNVCNGEKDHMYHHLSWVSHVINNPGERTEQCPFLIGKQGTGKSLLLSLYAELMSPHSIIVARSKSLLDKFFMSNLQHKIIVCVDEFRTHTREEFDQLKNNITCPLIHIEPKYHQATTNKNICNYIMSANPPNDQLHIETGETNRRFFLQESNPVYKLIDDNTKKPTEYSENIEKIIRIVSTDPIEKRKSYFEILDKFFRLLYKNDLFEYDRCRYPPSKVMDRMLTNRFDSFEQWIKECIIQQSFSLHSVLQTPQWDTQNVSLNHLYNSCYSIFTSNNKFERIQKSDFITKFNIYQTPENIFEITDSSSIKSLSPIEKFKEIFISHNKLTKNYFEHISALEVVPTMITRKSKRMENFANLRNKKQKTKPFDVDDQISNEKDEIDENISDSPILDIFQKRRIERSKKEKPKIQTKIDKNQKILDNFLI